MKEDSFDDELFSFFKDCYEVEFARRDRLFDRISLGVTLLTILGGLVAFYLSSFKPAAFTPVHLFFYIPLAAGVLLMGISLCLFGSATARGWEYHYLPDPDELAKYVEDLKQKNAPIDKDVEAQIRAAFIEGTTGNYHLCATLNLYVNEKRQKKLLHGFQLAIASLALLLVTALPFFILKNSLQDEPQKVNIAVPVEVKIEQ